MEPVRTCVGCRQRSLQSELVRIATIDQVAVIDVTRKLGGRGAWLHTKRQCFLTAIERGSIARTLRVKANLDTQGLAEQAEKMLAN